VLRFGQFVLKSGRQSPYFFNAGLFSSGPSLGAVCRSSSSPLLLLLLLLPPPHPYCLSFTSRCRAYAKAIKAAGVEFDVFFGPAYKGIPLAAATAIAWGDLFNESKDFCYNRKEIKDHGEVRYIPVSLLLLY
jgi:orotate phosphoribosyltransferase